MSPLKSNSTQQSTQQLKLSSTLATLTVAINLGETKYLSKVKNQAQVELLERILIKAKFERGKAIGERCWITKDRAVVVEDADYAVYLFPTIDKFILNDLFKVLEKENIPNLKEPLAKLNTLVWERIKSDDSAFLDTQEQILLLKTIIKALKSKPFSDNPKVMNILKDIHYWMKDWQRLNQLGFYDLPTLINALREFIKCL